MNNTLTHKGYGRIYVEKRDDIEKVKETIRLMDEFEYSYLPDELITVYTDFPKVVYTHKFSDMDIADLTNRCWNLGIKIWVFDSGHDEYAMKYNNNRE